MSEQLDEPISKEPEVQRRSRRLPLKLAVGCTVLQDAEFDATSSDISEGGLQLKGLPAELGVGCRLGLRMTVPSAHDVCEASGVVVWRSNEVAGVSFDSPTEKLMNTLGRFFKKYLLMAPPNDLRRYIDHLFKQ